MAASVAEVIRPLRRAEYDQLVALGAFQWVASVSTLPLLAHDDTLRAWLDRGFDLYGGIGRDPRMKPLFE